MESPENKALSPRLRKLRACPPQQKVGPPQVKAPSLLRARRSNLLSKKEAALIADSTLTARACAASPAATTWWNHRQKDKGFRLFPRLAEMNGVDLPSSVEGYDQYNSRYGKNRVHPE
jgi:hypothetical protein